MSSISIVLPARNEAENLVHLLPELQTRHPDAEIIVVDDGSTDATAAVCERFAVRCLRHPYSMGNGAAIKSGARAASGDVLVLMDADGQHNPADVESLLGRLDEGYEMAVGARTWASHASLPRRFANYVYNHMASYMAGHRVADLTSGFRAVRRRHFVRFLYLLPNGFSYPTTITMAFFRSGLPIAYVPIAARQREGRSHIRVFEDGLRFAVIIIKVGTLFSPMRLFLPVSGALLLLGLSYYTYTYFQFSRFTNMSAVVLLSSMLTFLIGILAELVSALHYKEADAERRLVSRNRDSEEL